MTIPKVCILRTDGTNCDEELFYAFEKFGANPQMVHVNELRNKSKSLKDFQILALPGGFSYGDDLASGKVLAIELISFLKSEIENFIASEKFTIGICNGFQTLVRTGLLPYNHLGTMDVTLAQNESGRFECRWVKVQTQKSKCKFIKEGLVMDIAINSGEGKFYSDRETIKKVEEDSLVVFRYVNQSNLPKQKYPANPNGSINAIAGICDPTGHILGLMPHPEKFVDITQHPNWRRQKFTKPHGSFIFENLIKFVKQS